MRTGDAGRDLPVGRDDGCSGIEHGRKASTVPLPRTILRKTHAHAREIMVDMISKTLNVHRTGKSKMSLSEFIHNLNESD